MNRRGAATRNCHKLSPITDAGDGIGEAAGGEGRGECAGAEE